MIRRVRVFANAADTQDEFNCARARRFSVVVNISVSKRPSVFLAAAREPLARRLTTVRIAGSRASRSASFMSGYPASLL
jgi:hypothetical protein